MFPVLLLVCTDSIRLISIQNNLRVRALNQYRLYTSTIQLRAPRLGEGLVPRYQRSGNRFASPVLSFHGRIDRIHLGIWLRLLSQLVSLRRCNYHPGCFHCRRLPERRAGRSRKSCVSVHAPIKLYDNDSWLYFRVVLRLWRVVKIVEELSAGAQEQLEDLERTIEDLESEKADLQKRIYDLEAQRSGRSHHH